MVAAKETRRWDSEVMPLSEHLQRLRDPARLRALAETALLDSEPEASFDRFTRLAARWLKAPVALISLVDETRQFFKSQVGVAEPYASARETPLSHSFCQHAVSTGEPLIVMDAREHPGLRDNLAVSALSVIAYAGVPLKTAEDQYLGALCAIDSSPREWSEDDVELLKELAALTMSEIELRVKVRRLRQLEQERAQEQALLHAILDRMADPVIVHDTRGQIVLSNIAARHGRPKPFSSVEEFVQGGVYELDGVTPLPLERTPAKRALRGDEVRDQELATRFPGRPLTFFSVNASPLKDESGCVYATVTVARDVTRARADERALARSEGILRSVLKHLPNSAVLLFDRELRYLAADGEQLLASVGMTREAMIGRTLAEVASAQGRVLAEPHYRAALAGETGRFEVRRGEQHYAATLVPVRELDGTISAGLALIYDVTQHKRVEQAALEDAAISRAASMKDELTQLCNRRGFVDLASKQLAIAQVLQRSALLFFIDLNGMKRINDQLGHEMGDAALIEMADILRATFRGSDVLARLGGDEFVALLLDANGTQVEHFSRRIEQEIATRNDRTDRAYFLSASIGGAVYDPDRSESIDALLARADGLMYEQKRRRKSQRD